MVGWTSQSLWTGRPLSSRSLASSSVWVIWRLIIGAPGLMLWNMYSIPGVLALLFRGKALVVNALALSRVWYMASLVHMPPWVLRELSFLAVVVQPSLFGGFSEVDVKLKVWALLGQWVRRFASSFSGWVSFM